MKSRPFTALAAVAAVAALIPMGMVAGCASASRTPSAQASAGTSARTTSPPPSSQPSSPSTAAVVRTVPGQLPTVYNCGGGAYKPSTLLIVCGVGSEMATGVEWTSWAASGASGHGDVHLPGRAAEPATLTLGQVVQTGGGPEFSQLKVTWTGPSPDGRAEDLSQLATAPAQG